MFSPFVCSCRNRHWGLFLYIFACRTCTNITTQVEHKHDTSISLASLLVYKKYLGVLLFLTPTPYKHDNTGGIQVRY